MSNLFNQDTDRAQANPGYGQGLPRDQHPIKNKLITVYDLDLDHVGGTRFQTVGQGRDMDIEGAPRGKDKVAHDLLAVVMAVDAAVHAAVLVGHRPLQVGDLVHTVRAALGS